LEKEYNEEEDEDELLPEPDMENLGYISKEISTTNLINSKLPKLIEFLTNDNGKFFKQLGDIINQEEKIKRFENLTIIFTIFKNIFAIADQSIIEMLVSDQFYKITFTALEYRHYFYIKSTLMQLVLKISSNTENFLKILILRTFFLLMISKLSRRL